MKTTTSRIKFYELRIPLPKESYSLSLMSKSRQKSNSSLHKNLDTVVQAFRVFVAGKKLSGILVSVVCQNSDHSCLTLSIQATIR